MKHIGSTHNRSALPFTGFGSKVVTNQYNNPSGLYSSENIKDFNTAVDEVKTMAAPNEPNSKYDKPNLHFFDPVCLKTRFPKLSRVLLSFT